MRTGFDAHPMLHATYPAPYWSDSTPATTLRVLAGAVLLACMCDALAQESPAWAAYREGTQSFARSEEPALPSDEITAMRSRLQAPAMPLSRLDARTANDLAGAGRRVWISRGRTGIGVGIGMQRYLVPAANEPGDLSRAVVGAVPALTVGVRYRVSSEHSLFAGAYGARGLATDPATPLYAAKVGVEWRPAKSNLGLEQGAIGMHFDSGYKLSLKMRRGGPTVYLRGQF